MSSPIHTEGEWRDPHQLLSCAIGRAWAPSTDGRTSARVSEAYIAIASSSRSSLPSHALRAVAPCVHSSSPSTPRPPSQGVQVHLPRRYSKLSAPQSHLLHTFPQSAPTFPCLFVRRHERSQKKHVGKPPTTTSTPPNHPLYLHHHHPLFRSALEE